MELFCKALLFSFRQLVFLSFALVNVLAKSLKPLFPIRAAIMKLIMATSTKAFGSMAVKNTVAPTWIPRSKAKYA